MAKIIHIMADGTVRDSVEGYKVPRNESTELLYQFLETWTPEPKEEGLHLENKE